MLLLPLEGVKQNPTYQSGRRRAVHSLQVFDLARDALPYDEEFCSPPCCSDVGKAIDLRDHVRAALESLEGTITPRTAWLIEHTMEAAALRDGKLGARAAAAWKRRKITRNCCSCAIATGRAGKAESRRRNWRRRSTTCADCRSRANRGKEVSQRLRRRTPLANHCAPQGAKRALHCPQILQFRKSVNSKELRASASARLGPRLGRLSSRNGPAANYDQARGAIRCN